MSEANDTKEELGTEDIASTSALALANLKGNLTYVSASFIKMWGYEVEKELLGKPITKFWKTKEKFLEAEVALCDKGIWEGALVAQRKDGSIFNVHLSATMATDQTGVPVSMVVSIIDATEYTRLLQALRENKEHYRLLAENTSDVIWTLDLELNFTYISPSIKALTGFTVEEAMDLALADLFTEDSLALVMKAIADLMGPAKIERLEQNFDMEKRPAKALPQPQTLEVKQKCKDDSGFWAELKLSILRDADGRPMGILGVTRDISELKEAEEKRRFLALHDGLTGLPNRILFNDRLTVALAHAQRNHQNLCVLSLNLDRFKEVNDRLGYIVANKLLQQVAVRLTSLLRKSDSVARLGADQFFLLLPTLIREKDASTVAQKIVEAFRKPFEFEGQSVSITASIGLAIYPEDGQNADALIKNANSAMYRAKEEGRDNYQRFNPSKNAEAGKR